MNNLDDPMFKADSWSSTIKSPVSTTEHCLPSTSRNIVMKSTSTASLAVAPEQQAHHHSRHSHPEISRSRTSPGIHLRRDGSVEKSFRPKNYRSQPSSLLSSGDHNQGKSLPTVTTSAKIPPTMFDVDKNVHLEQPSTSSPSFSTSIDSDDGDGNVADNDDDDSNSQVQKSLSITNLKKDNQMLYSSLDDGRKALIIRKALNSFMYGALKKQSDNLYLLEMRVKMKAEECAARLILHSLLLNSYRHTQRDLEDARVENTQRNKAVENLCLQLRVVRHLQATEKERAIERTHEISTLKSEISLLKIELEKSKQNLAGVEKQLYDEQTACENIVQEKLKIQEKLTGLQEEIELVNGSLDLEKKQVAKYTEAAKLLKKRISESKHQMKELVCQSTQWQERARTQESENWELQHRVQNGAKELAQLKKDFESLVEENRALISERDSIQKKKANLELKLNELNNESFNYSQNLSTTKHELEKQRQFGLELEAVLMQYKDENKLMKDELFAFKLRNMKKRRAWVQFFMSIINPLETIRLFVLGPSSNDVGSLDGRSEENGPIGSSQSNLQMPGLN